MMMFKHDGNQFLFQAGNEKIVFSADGQYRTINITDHWLNTPGYELATCQDNYLSYQVEIPSTSGGLEIAKYYVFSKQEGKLFGQFISFLTYQNLFGEFSFVK